MQSKKPTSYFIFYGKEHLNPLKSKQTAQQTAQPTQNPNKCTVPSKGQLKVNMPYLCVTVNTLQGKGGGGQIWTGNEATF